MHTIIYSHPSFFAHDTGGGHPESALRLRAIETVLKRPDFAALVRNEAPCASMEQLRLVHTQSHIDRVFELIPAEGEDIVFLDPDTIVSSRSGEAALHAAGAGCAAVDAVFSTRGVNAFCAVRPPGHHAMPEAGMGFCLFNNVAIAAEHARKVHGIRRVAIIDFDVHHGNGTQAAFEANRDVLYASTHQYPWYPGTGGPSESGVGNVINVGLKSGSGSIEFRSAMTGKILPAVDRFKPELLLISAGFDAHRDDPLASLNFTEEDFAWITRQLILLADRHAKGRLVSLLEGGYNLEALGESVAAHVKELMKASADNA